MILAQRHSSSKAILMSELSFFMFIYCALTVPLRHINGYSKDVCQCDVIAELLHTYPNGLTRNFNETFSNVDNPSDSVLLSETNWKVRNLFHPDTRELLSKTESIVFLLNALVSLLTPST